MNPRLQHEFLEAVHSREPVTGLTHDFYRYPARFSPQFVRSTIKAFTQPGDVVLDPFMGGGTTLVEARTLGRRAVGVDINKLAVFVSRVKTTPLSEADLLKVCSWADGLIGRLNLHLPPVRPTQWAQLGYQRNISGKSTWPIRKTIEFVLANVGKLPKPRQQRFARCVLLRTAQWALDCRKEIPTAKQFRERFLEYLLYMIEGVEAYTDAIRKADRLYDSDGPFRSLSLHRSVVGLETDPRVAGKPAPALILTSPPYPGVHVLYHRWQVQGRSETPAPFWIANALDGNGASFYTFGDRKRQELTSYYEQALAAFSSLARIATRDTLLIQLVAFSDPLWQLPKCLSLMEQAGFVEIRDPAFANSADGRMWRNVPNRKWYADQHGAIPASKEAVLFHRLD